MPQEKALIGREREMMLLAGHPDAARAGDARTILIGGEAGVGKSCVLRAFLDQARASGAHVLSGTTEEHFGDPMPYGPMLDALEGFVGDYGADPAGGLGGPACQMLTRFFDLGGEPMSSQQQVFLAVRRMLSHIGSDAPVVLALEDLHWSGAFTLDLVRYLGQARPEGRLLLVCTYRSTGVEQDAPMLWQLLGSASFFRRTERVELTRFGLKEMRALVNGASGGQVDPRLVQRCYDWSSGNPFFAEQRQVQVDAGVAHCALVDRLA